MKIDILSTPRVDIFRNRGKYTVAFIFFLALAGAGVLLGVYTIVSATRYYEILEKVSAILFVGSAVPVFITGEKLQAYRRLTPEQKKELEDLCRKYSEIQDFCHSVAESGRHIIFAEYQACKDFGEERELQELAKQKSPK